MIDDKKEEIGWVDIGSGIHLTRAGAIIREALLAIKEQHILCLLVARDYESGLVALVDFGPERLGIDRPVDWPPEMGPQTLRIIYKDRGGIWNQLSVELLEVTPDTLITTMPSRYVRLQRREGYRVEAPPGSKLVFLHQQEPRSDFALENISSDGVLMGCERRDAGLKVGDLIQKISLTLPGGEGGDTCLEIEEGRVVRSFRELGRGSCFGVHFRLQPREERALLKYVRRRELELLRKGVA